MYDKLVAQVNSIDNSGFVLKTKYETHKSDLEKKMPDTSRLVKKSDYVKITDIENKILSLSGLAINAALTAVENKVPYVSSLVKKTDYNAKVNKIEEKLLIVIAIDILLLQNLISLRSFWSKISVSKFNNKDRF